MMMIMMMVMIMIMVMMMMPGGGGQGRTPGRRGPPWTSWQGGAAWQQGQQGGQGAHVLRWVAVVMIMNIMMLEEVSAKIITDRQFGEQRSLKAAHQL